jgi:hypothetical protein
MRNQNYRKVFNTINNSKANLLNSIGPAHFNFRTIESLNSVIVAMIHFNGFEENKKEAIK